MGLWLKCPVCQATNLLSAQVCTSCESSLKNLPVEKRVYILAASAAGPTPKAPPAAAATPAPAEAAPAPAKKTRKSKGPRSKKS